MWLSVVQSFVSESVFHIWCNDIIPFKRREVREKSCHTVNNLPIDHALVKERSQINICTQTFGPPHPSAMNKSIERIFLSPDQRKKIKDLTIYSLLDWAAEAELAVQISVQCFWCSWGVLWTNFKTNPLLLLWFVYGKQKWCSRKVLGQRSRFCMGSCKPAPLQCFADNLSGDLIKSEYPNTSPILTLFAW